jgi:hypothetical protein
MQESQGKQQAQCRVEDKQVKAESTIQTLRSDVQTQTPDRDHQLVQLMKNDQAKQSQRETATPFIESVVGWHKQGKVAFSIHSQKLNRTEPVPLLCQPRVALSSHTKVRPLNLQNGTVPDMLNTETQVKLARPQSPVSINKYILFEEATNTEKPVSSVSIGGASDAILESVHQPVSIEQLIQESENTRRMVALDDKVSREATARRREHMMKELNEKFRKWDIKHKEFLKITEKLDSEQLSRILIRKSSEATPRFNKDVIRSELAAVHAPVTVEQQDNSAAESLLQAQVTVYCKAKNTVIG